MSAQPFEPFMVDVGYYKKMKELGRGRFGRVNLVEKKGEDGKKVKYAIRVVSLNDEKEEEDTSSDDDDDDDDDIDDDDGSPTTDLTKHFFREVGTYIQTKSHPVICKFYGFSAQPKEIVLEYLENGSLQDIFNKLLKGKTVDYWDGTMKSKTVFGIACALLHLQNQGVFHRYLTPSSILYDSNYEPRLVDFAYSKFNANKVKHTVTNSSWPIYRAPEIDTEVYNHKVDNFSYGVILYQIITGKEAFDSKLGPFQVNKLISSGKRPPLPTECPKLAKIVGDLWSANPTQRPELIYIIKFLYDYDQELFPGTDMDDYNSYKERVWKSTDMTSDQRAFINQPKLTPENVEQFQRQMKEAEKGDPKDMVKLARSIERGVGTAKNVSLAITWYQKAADLGEPESLYKIANFHSTGRHQIEASNSQYIKYLKLSFDSGYPPAINDYAYLLLTGSNGVKQDEAAAVKLLQKMANPPYNNIEAMYRLACYYEKIKNTTEAINYYNKARDEGYEYAHCDYALMLMRGNGVTKNVDEGMKIMKQAAERGFPTANHNLGFIYEHGEFGIEKNQELAFKYYEAAANKDYLKYMVKVGKAKLKGTFNGLVVPKDEIMAVRYFQIAAEKGDPEGLHSWASCLQNGYGGIPIDISKAISFYEMAIKKDFTPSMLRLGDLYNSGIQGERDIIKAKEYYELAKSKGAKNAEQKLKDLGF